MVIRTTEPAVKARYYSQGQSKAGIKYMLSRLNFPDLVTGMMMFNMTASRVASTKKHVFSELKYSLEDCDVIGGEGQRYARPIMIEPGQYYLRL